MARGRHLRPPCVDGSTLSGARFAGADLVASLKDASAALRLVSTTRDVANGGRVPRADIDTASLYARYAPAVARRVRQFYRQAEVEEVVAEVFLKVVQRAHTFRGDCHPYTWLYALTTNHCLTRVRQARRREELLTSEGRLSWQPEVTVGGAEAKVFLAELWRSLDPELAEIGIYYHIDGLSQEEIGRLVGVSGRTIGTRLRQLTAAARRHAGIEEDA